MPNQTPVKSTRIRLGNRYRIESDAHGWTLFTAYTGKTKEGDPVIRWRESYFGRLDHAAQAIVRDGPGVGDDHAGAQSIVDAINQAVVLIREAIREAGIANGAPMD